ncbi:hypothetical protein AXX16_2211 [Serratia rubidaea]|nr:hypothetical protein AXX16_2211 [Serratia rubidaea]
MAMSFIVEESHNAMLLFLFCAQGCPRQENIGVAQKEFI